jgi:hypothetical protein
MTVQEQLSEVLQEMPEARVRQVLDFARFLSWEDEARAWREFGKTQLGKAYGDDEPEYTLADLKQEPTQ